MKIKAHIISVEDQGESLIVKAVGWQGSDPDGTMARPFTLTLKSDTLNKSCARVGRNFTLDLRWKR